VILITRWKTKGGSTYKRDEDVKSSGYGWIKISDNGSENATALQGISVQDFGRRIRRYKVKISLMVWGTL
jgi:hypothetical protein